MTREEAIKIINCYDIGFYDLSGEKIPAHKLAEVFDMAIEALSENPKADERIIQSGDLISRADALNEIQEFGRDVGCLTTEQIAEGQRRLRKIPSAEAAEVVHDTEWVAVRRDEYEDFLASAEAVHKPDYSYEADMFKRLRQAEALQADWIPITELEPNTSDHVLVTYRWGDDDYEVSEMDYWITKYEAENGNAQCKRLIDNVIAWRYMLAPYKGGEE